MLSNRLAFAALGVASLAAAAAGGYYVARQTAAPPAASPVAAVNQAPAPEARSTASTGVVGSDTAPVASADVPAPAAQAAPKKSAPVASPRPAAPSRAARSAATDAPSASDRSVPNASPAPAPVPAEPPVVHEERAAVVEPPRPPEPPAPAFEELVVPADAVIGLETDRPVSSESARVEDRVDARVTRDVRVGERVAIPAGTRVVGTVTQVDRGGRFREAARLGIRFNTLELADGSRLPISTDTIWRHGQAPGNSSASKIGGAAVGGAIIGAIIGGSKGAMIGATAGAGAGTAAVAAGDRSAATLAPRTPVTVRLVAPVTVTLER